MHPPPKWFQSWAFRNASRNQATSATTAEPLWPGEIVSDWPKFATHSDFVPNFWKIIRTWISKISARPGQHSYQWNTQFHWTIAIAYYFFNELKWIFKGHCNFFRNWTRTPSHLRRTSTECELTWMWQLNWSYKRRRRCTSPGNPNETPVFLWVFSISISLISDCTTLKTC